MVSSASIRVRPTPNHSVCDLVIGNSSSWPHAYRRYACHECRNAATTASIRSFSGPLNTNATGCQHSHTKPDFQSKPKKTDCCVGQISMYLILLPSFKSLCVKCGILPTKSNRKPQTGKNKSTKFYFFLKILKNSSLLNVAIYCIWCLCINEITSNDQRPLSALWHCVQQFSSRM